MKIQALNIQVGDRIVAYCNNKMKVCTVHRVMDTDQNNITLTVCTSVQYRSSVSHVVRFHRDAFVDLAS